MNGDDTYDLYNLKKKDYLGKNSDIKFLGINEITIKSKSKEEVELYFWMIMICSKAFAFEKTPVTQIGWLIQKSMTNWLYTENPFLQKIMILFYILWEKAIIAQIFMILTPRNPCE